jgi:prohibitin 2
MASKYGNLATLGGLMLLGASSCYYIVDPGEKALIMNNLTGLRSKVYGQGIHFKIPVIEVPPL